MNNQQLSKVEIGKSGFKRSRFNFSRDVNTTADFGTTQPLQVKALVPGTKSVVNTKSLTRLAPMVAPAFGRVKFKLWHEFVPCADVCDYFDSMMAQQSYYCSGSKNLKKFTYVSSMPLNLLSWFCLIGSRCSIYQLSQPSRGATLSIPVVTKNGSTYTGDSITAAADGFLGTQANGPFTISGADDFSTASSNHVVIRNRFFYNTGIGMYAPVNNEIVTASGSNHYYDFMKIVDTSGNVLNDVVTPEGADIVYEYVSSGSYWALCFRLSSFGKRLRKILIGCGYQLDLVSDRPVSLLPVFAYYKAYWNLFGLTQWQLWENTSLYVLMKYLSSYGYENLDATFFASGFANHVALFAAFINDLANCYVTDNVDFVSAHLPSTAVSPSVSMPFVDVNVSDVVTEVDSQGSSTGQPSNIVNGHSFISQLNHGELDSEYLKRLYKWTNKNTIVGRRIAEVLRSQGLGKYVDGCTTDFIGYTEDEITISDVVSSADTSFAGTQGARLGQYGGKGLQYTEGKTFTFENDQFGYWITIAAIVPESGYMRQFDPTLFARDKFSFYNPDFDSMGFEASTKRVVVGGCDWNETTPIATGTLDATFGYCPRYFGWKFSTNINNGDMTLRGVRNSYLPFTLDKLIPVCEPRFERLPSGALKRILELEAANLPIADERVYRPIGKYPWMAHYDRIFAEDDSLNIPPYKTFGELLRDQDLSAFLVNSYDNFLIHNIVNFVAYSPMKPVEESFETTDEDDKSTMSVQKA